MLYRVLKRTIERGGYNAAGMLEKLDVFFAVESITATEHAELRGMVADGAAE